MAPPQPAAEAAGLPAMSWTWWTALWLYARLLVWPSGLSIVHDLPLVAEPWSWAVGAGLLVCAAALWTGLRLRTSAPGATFGILVLLIGMAPLSNVLVRIGSHQASPFPVAERFLYAPSIGFCLAAGWLFMEAAARARLPIGRGAQSAGGGLLPLATPLRRAAPWVALGLAIATAAWSSTVRARDWRPRSALARALAAAPLGLAVLAGAWSSVLRARDWKDEVALFASALERSPRSAMAQLNYGTALVDRARDAAEADRRRSLLQQAQAHLEEAAALAPDNYRSHYNLANLHQSLGRPRAAEASFREALRLNPGLFRAMVNLGAILAQTERSAEALVWFDRASRLEPGNLAVLVNRAHVLQELGRPEESIPLYRQALQAAPDLVAARAGLDRALKTLAQPSSKTP